MSVIQKIRDKYAGVVIAFIAISLIAFILMDAFTGRGRGGSLFGNSSSVGKVNGTKIDINEFQKKSALYRKAYGNQATDDQIRSTTWNNMVENIIMSEELEELGLTISSKELNDILFGDNPPQWLRQNFTDPNTGMYNSEAVAEWFRRIKNRTEEDAEFKEQIFIQEQTIDQTLRQKYLALISAGNYVPKWLAEKQLNENNAMSSIAYVTVPYTSLPDSTFKPTDDQIKDYVKKHAAEYKVEEASRTVSYVSFDVKPSSTDSAAALNEVTTHTNEFRTTPDSMQESFLARAGTEMPYADNYFKASKIQHAFKDSIAKAGVGNLYGPYLDGNMYVLAKMMGVKQIADSARVRHILIKTDSRPDDVAKKLADSIQTAIKNGANFDTLAMRFSDDGSKLKGGFIGGSTNDRYYFGEGEMVPEFQQFAFEKNVGEKGVVRTQFGYHYIEVVAQKSPQTAYKIAYLAKSISASQETNNAAMEAAQRFAAESHNQKEYNANLTKYNKQSLQSMDIHDYETNGGGMGDNREFVRWVFKNDLGDVSEPFNMGDKVIVAMINNIQDKGTMNVATAKRAGVEQFIIRELKAQKIIAEKFKGKTLQEFSASSGMPIVTADSISYVSQTIPNVGPEGKIIGIAFNEGMKEKDSGPIAGTSGVFAVRVTNIGARSTGQRMEDIRTMMQGNLKNNAFMTAASLRKAASIKDYRSDFF